MKVVLMLIACVLLTPQAFAFDYYFDSQFADGTSPFDHNNNWSPIDYPNGVGQLPSPGNYDPGGEFTDLEGIQVTFDENNVYVAIANSFGYSIYSDFFNETYGIGDLFIGINGGNKYQYGIDITDIANGSLSTTSLYSVSSWNYITDNAGSYYDNVTIREAVGAWTIADGQNLGDVSFIKQFAAGYEQNPMKDYNPDTYVWEFSLSRDLFAEDISSMQFHLNVECGNDLIEGSFAVVPEPTAFVLFGIGLLGAGVYRRYRR